MTDADIFFIIVTAAFMGLAVGASLLMLSRRRLPKIAGSLFLIVGALCAVLVVITIAHNV